VFHKRVLSILPKIRKMPRRTYRRKTRTGALAAPTQRQTGRNLTTIQAARSTAKNGNARSNPPLQPPGGSRQLKATEGEIMKIRLSLWSLALGVSLTALGCAFPKQHNLPPAIQLMEPGPGVGGPGPGVLPPTLPPQFIPVSMPTVQVLFARPEAMQIRWDVTGMTAFDSTPLVVPGRQNFPSNGLYRLKLTNISGREGTELYPTIEIGPATPRTEAFLAHNAIPIQFTEEDFDQVLAGNFVTKVIYLPDPEFQELALAGVETLVSTRLDPGVDPITEADRRGSILAVIRLGNKDIELGGGGAALAGFDGAMMMGGTGGPGCPIGPGGQMMGGPMPMGGVLPPNYVAGVTAAQYGMPITGTPIGLPGPPHIPLGGPAGMQRHTMVNHTHMNIPGPTQHFDVHVKQRPGFSYPKPVNHMYIREQMIAPSQPYEQPHWDMHERIPGGAPYGYNAAGMYGPPAGAAADGYCPPGAQPGAQPGAYGPPMQQ
jgi:hypothetical protein